MNVTLVATVREKRTVRTQCAIKDMYEMQLLVFTSNKHNKPLVSYKIILAVRAHKYSFPRQLANIYLTPDCLGLNLLGDIFCKVVLA